MYSTYLYTLQYELLWYVIKNFWKFFVPIIVTSVVNILFKKVVVYNLITKRVKWKGWKREEMGDFILLRAVFHLYDLWMLITTLVTGFMTAVIRFIITVGVALVTLTSANTSPLPAWIERYVLLDTGSKSFQAVLKANHDFNNPIFRVACWLLTEDSARRRDTGGAATGLAPIEVLCGQLKLVDEGAKTETKKNNEPDTSQPQERVDKPDDTTISVKTHRRSGLGVLRWRLAIMLHRFPQLRFYRAHYLAQNADKVRNKWKQQPATSQNSHADGARAMPDTASPPLSDSTDFVKASAERAIAEIANR